VASLQPQLLLLLSQPNLTYLPAAARRSAKKAMRSPEVWHL